MVHDICRRLATACLGLACLLIFALAVIGALDAVATNSLGRPLPAVFEMTEVGVALIIFLSQPYAVFQGAHIKVNLFAIKNRPLHRLRSLLILVLSGLSYSVLAIGIWRSMARSIAVSEQSIGLYSFPIWPFKIAVFCCVAITVFIILCMILFGEDLALTDSDEVGEL